MELDNGYTADEVARRQAAGHWTDETFGDFLRHHAEARPDAIAVSDGDASLTWSGLLDEVQRVAHSLADLGVRAGDRVSIQLPNCIELPVAIMAVWEAGAVYQPLNPMYRRAELTSVMSLVEPRVIITADPSVGFDHPALLDEVCAGADLAPTRIVVGRAPGWVSWDDLRGEASLPPPDPLRVALLGTTSGTTGDPKVYIHVQATQIFEARALVQGLEITPNDVMLAAAPITHRGALMVGLFTSMMSGSTLVVGDARDTHAISRLIEDTGVTMFMGIPTIVSDLLALHEADTPSPIHSSLRCVVVSGAPVTDELLQRFTTHWPDTVAATGYGLSETGWCTFLRVGDPVDKIATSGRLAPATEIEIRDEAGSVVAAGETGEVYIRGPMTCGGYYRNPRATAATIDEAGWFKSGDLAVMDPDGYIQPVGRSKHMIIRGGLNIYAEEIERILEEHPAVDGAVVIGVPDDRLGERACACVVVADGLTFDLATLRRHCEEAGIARYTWPERVELLTELPRNPIGKIDRLAVERDVQSAAAFR